MDELPEEDGPSVCQDELEGDLVWIQRETVRALIERDFPEMLQNDRSFRWLVVVLDSYCCTIQFGLTDRSAADLVRQVQQDADLKCAVVGAFRMGASAFDIASLIEERRIA